ncbi:MAG: sulfatase-like hydrolase/transferase [Spirochaetales bacterium]|nr:sulfatase-like hydrolase/transferase [Spirochaetales bacterium]
MKRKRWLLLGGLLLAALLVFALLPVASRRYSIEFDDERIRAKQAFLSELARIPREEDRPNILLILADDLGKTDLSLYGGRLVQTERIDALAQQGVRFTDAYCTSALCSPSRAAMLTGRYQQRFGYELQPATRYPRNRLEYLIYKYLLPLGYWKVAELAVPRAEDMARQGLPPSEITLSELLVAAGYRTALIGKWHLGHNEPFLPNERGFEHHYGFYEAFTLYDDVDDPDIVNAPLDEFSDRYQRSQGRSGTSAIRVNDVIVEEEGYLTDRIAEEAIGFLERSAAGASADGAAEPFFLYVSFSAPHVPFQAKLEDYERFSHVKDHTKRVYGAMIYSLDQAVGRILDRLAELGLEEETLVVFGSDNGGAFHTGATDNAPLKGGKFTQFEGGVNVPMLMRWPGVIPAGRVYQGTVSLLDVFATAAGAARCPLPADRVIDGRDLRPHLSQGSPEGPREQPQEGAQEEPHPTVLWRALYSKAVRAGNWKMLLNAQTGAAVLYDLESDPGEHRNLAAQHPEKVRELKEILEAWEEGLVPPLWPRVMDFEVTIDGEVFRFAI